MPGGHTRAIFNSKETSRLLNTLEARLCRGGHRERDKTIEGSVELCQEDIECVQRVHKKNSISSSEIREVSEEDTHRVVEYSVGSTSFARAGGCQEGTKTFHLKSKTRVESLRDRTS
jgi:hypothetical protein